MEQVCPYSNKANIHYFVNDGGTVCDNDCKTVFCKLCGGEFWEKTKIQYIEQIPNYIKSYILGHDPNCGEESEEW